MYIITVKSCQNGGERDCCPRLSPAGAPLPAGDQTGHRTAFSGAPADNPGQQSLSPPCSQFLLNHGRDYPGPTTSLVVEITETSEDPTQCRFSPSGSSMQACVIVLRVMRHDTNSRTVINTSISACGERGGNPAPCDDIWGQIPNRRV